MKRLILLCLLFVSFVVSAQTEDFVTEKIQLNYLGLSESTINFRNIPLIGATREKIGDDREGRRKNLINNPAALLEGIDPVLQASTPTIQVAVNQQLTVEGPDYTNASLNPPDVNGEIGGTYYVHTINGSGSQVRVYNKADGTLAGQFSTNTALWNPLNLTSLGDPVILYDEVAQRWILVEMRNTGNQILFAVSQTNNPLGAWHLYAFSTSAFPDFPKLSIWNNAILMTDNENRLSAAPIYAINKSAVYAGTASTILRTTLKYSRCFVGPI